MKPTIPRRSWPQFRDIECELIALGGAPDLELARAIEAVECALPGARLVDVRKLK
jgi:hypothetical protein